MQPSAHVLAAFGAPPVAVPLTGGQGTSFRAGDIVLKPTADPIEAVWSAKVVGALSGPGFRVARPVLTADSEPVIDGWTAWTWLEGEPAGRNGGRWAETIACCRAFHEALDDVDRPAFLARRTDVWANADRIAWAEQELTVPGKIAPPYARLCALRRPIALRSQVIHGDFTANALFAPGLDPAVIDFSPYWRPAGFAIAVIVADALVWGGAGVDILDLVDDVAEFPQLLLRAELRRLIEVELHDRAANRERPEHVAQHETTIDLVCRLAAQ